MKEEEQIARLTDFIHAKRTEWAGSGWNTDTYVQYVGREQLAKEFANDARFAETHVCDWFGNPGKVAEQSISNVVLNSMFSSVNISLFVVADEIRAAILIACGIKNKNTGAIVVGGLMAVLGIVVLALIPKDLPNE